MQNAQYKDRYKAHIIRALQINPIHPCKGIRSIPNLNTANTTRKTIIHFAYTDLKKSNKARFNFVLYSIFLQTELNKYAMHIDNDAPIIPNRLINTTDKTRFIVAIPT